MTKEVLSKKIVLNYEKLARVVEGQRIIGRKIIITIGSWDLLHIGHARYLLKASSYGDILIVGVDSDEVVKKYKGEYRPIVPEKERLEMLIYLSFVDYLTTVADADHNGNWKYGLLKKIKPDVFVAVKDSYPKKQLDEIKKYCKKVIVLPRQAESTSTSDTVQHLMKEKMVELISLASKGGKR